MSSLNIEKVYSLMGRVLSDEASALQNYVHRVAHRPGVIGAILGADGVLYYDEVWWNKHIDTPEKAKHAIAFEIMRKVLGADRRGSGWVDRVATGMVINAYLYHAYGFSELPRALYKANDLPECLMRPFSRGYPTRLRRVYQGVWDRVKDYTLIANVARALKILLLETSAELMPPGLDPNGVSVLGYTVDEDGTYDTSAPQVEVPGFPETFDHGAETDGKTKKDRKRIPIDKLPEDIMEHLANGVAKTAGYSDESQDFVTKKIKERRTFQSKLIEEFAMDAIKRMARKYVDDYEFLESPFPTRLGMRDIFSLARGITPLMYSKQEDIIAGQGGLAVYVDVSGSFHSWIPYALGVVESMADLVDGMYQFSNQIQETSLAELKKNNVRIDTTGGTDFDCILRHAIDKGYDRVVIITDGYAEVTNKKLREEAALRVSKVLAILITQLPNRWGSTDAKSKESYLKSTWLGKHYGAALDLSEAFK